jgi:hypothetical protein
MSSTMKLGLLALVSSAAAMPHWGHNRHHRKGKGKSTGYVPFPTGGYNSTLSLFPTGTGTGNPGTGFPEPTTTIINTAVVTETLVSTIYATRPSGVPGNSLLPLDVSSVAPVCGPETIVVTATEKVTVTVGAVSSSSAIPVVIPTQSGDAEIPVPPKTSRVVSIPSKAPLPPSSAPVVVPSSAAPSSVAEKPTSAPVLIVSTPPPTPEPVSSTAAPVPSSTYGKRSPQNWANIDYSGVDWTKIDYSGVDWSKIDYNKPAPPAPPAPAPAPPAPAPAPPAPAPPPPPPVIPQPNPPSPPSPPSPPPSPSANPQPVPPPPPPSTGNGYSGKKRGLAYNDINLCSAFSGNKIGFAYNWGQAENGNLPAGAQFIPMMHKPSDSTPEAFLANIDKAVSKGTQAVMTFNEPDHAQQANLSPGAACEAWARYIAPISASHPNVEIMSPSVTNGPAPMGLDWLSRFQKECAGAKFHSVNIHWYDQYDGETFNRFKAHVEKAASTFPGLSIWLTEFGLNPGTANAEQASSFLKQAIGYLDGHASIKGYAWFMVGTDTSFNMLNSGNGLSSTGQVYAS